MISSSVFLAIIFCLFTPAISGPVQAKRFTVNLDLPPEERWTEILKGYAQFVPDMKKDIRSLIPTSVFPLVEQLALYLDKYFPAPYPAEMRGIAKAWNVNVTDVILLNILYDLSAYCTSIVAQDKSGNIYHARNLDYAFSNTLRKMAFMVDFQTKGSTVYSGVTFGGMIGLLTAQKPNALTITLNERDRGYIWENIFQALLNKEALPITFEIRNIVASDEMDFDQGVKALTTIPMIADAYLIVGGVKANQGAVVTRNRISAADVWTLDVNNGIWFLVETNYDHWTTPPPSDDRRDPAIKSLKNIGQENINGTALFKVLNQPPVLAKTTTYTAIMAAKQPGLLNAWIQELS